MATTRAPELLTAARKLAGAGWTAERIVAVEDRSIAFLGHRGRGARDDAWTAQLDAAGDVLRVVTGWPVDGQPTSV